jgi:hypothetical protein
MNENTKTELLTIEMPLDGFSPEKLENLQKLIDSKAVLIKKALGAEELPIEVTETSIKFAWFPTDLEGETVHAYSQFVTALCETAKRKTRIVAQPKEAYENEKFAMRVYGLGLGLKGSEYTLCRKLLMKNLTGDSSWRFTKPEKGERKPRREKVHREVLSIRLTPDMLEKVAILASQKEERISRNMLIESIIEDYVKAAFPEQEVETTPVPEETPTETPTQAETETAPIETPAPAEETPQDAPASPKPRKKRNKQA